MSDEQTYNFGEARLKVTMDKDGIILVAKNGDEDVATIIVPPAMLFSIVGSFLETNTLTTTH